MNRAEEFALLLDNARFDEAMEFVSESCTYRHHAETHVGKRGILAMYRQQHDMASRMFDEIENHTEVELIDGDSCRFHFIDRLRKGDRWHEAKSEQIIRFDDGLVVEITQKDLPGENEAVREFYLSANKR